MFNINLNFLDNLIFVNHRKKSFRIKSTENLDVSTEIRVTSTEISDVTTEIRDDNMEIRDTSREIRDDTIEIRDTSRETRDFISALRMFFTGFHDLSLDFLYVSKEIIDTSKATYINFTEIRGTLTGFLHSIKCFKIISRGPPFRKKKDL